MENYEGTEWCPYCEGETHYDVPENVMIVKCQVCGRPILLCDKCYTMCLERGIERPCGNCKYDNEILKLRKEWEDDQVGKIVTYIGDDGNESVECEVLKVDDINWTLKAKNGSVINCFDSEIGF